MFAVMKEIAKLQRDYRNLLNGRKITKKAMCDLVIPFRDKYHLKGLSGLGKTYQGLFLSEFEETINVKEY